MGLLSGCRKSFAPISSRVTAEEMQVYESWLRDRKLHFPEDIIQAVTNILVGFKRTCRDFGIANDRVKIIATEATRVAKNSEAFRSRIQRAMGMPTWWNSFSNSGLGVTWSVS